MVKQFKRGDRVKWNSEAGMVRGTVIKKVTSDVNIKGYTHHASKDEEPQYMIKSEKTDHVAIHKGAVLQRIRSKKSRQGKRSAKPHTRRR